MCVVVKVSLLVDTGFPESQYYLGEMYSRHSLGRGGGADQEAVVIVGNGRGGGGGAFGSRCCCVPGKGGKREREREGHNTCFGDAH